MIDSIFWWIGCIFSVAGGVYFLVMFLAFFVDKIFIKMNAIREFLFFVQWKRNKKKNHSADFNSWLKTVCFQEPTPEAHALAEMAWKAAGGKS